MKKNLAIGVAAFALTVVALAVLVYRSVSARRQWVNPFHTMRIEYFNHARREKINAAALAGQTLPVRGVPEMREMPLRFAVEEWFLEDMWTEPISRIHGMESNVVQDFVKGPEGVPQLSEEPSRRTAASMQSYRDVTQEIAGRLREAVRLTPDQDLKAVKADMGHPTGYVRALRWAWLRAKRGAP